MKAVIDKKEVGLIIKREREKRNYTKKELADMINIPVRKLIEYEKGEHYLNLKDLLSISNIFKMPIDDILKYSLVNWNNLKNKLK